MAQSSKLGLLYKREYQHRSPHHEPLAARKDQKSTWNPGSKQRLLAREREIKALDLRKRGMSYSEIATALGVTPAAAYQMLMRVLEAYDRDIKEEVPRVRQIELQRLDYYLDCLQKKIKAGDVAAIGKAITIGERRAKLLGLDAPTKVAATDTDGNDLDKMSEEELQKRAAQLIINLGVVIEK